MNSYTFARKAYDIRTNFVQIRKNLCLWIGYRLAGFATFRFGRRLGVVDAFGAGLSLDDG